MASVEYMLGRADERADVIALLEMKRMTFIDTSARLPVNDVESRRSFITSAAVVSTLSDMIKKGEHEVKR